MAEHYYITGIGVSQYYYGAQRLGLPAERILRRCGMRPEITLQPMEQTSMEQFERFLLELILESGDDQFGMHVGEQVMPSLYGVLPTLATMAGSVREGLDLALRYQALVGGNAGSIRLLQEQGDNLIFEGLMAYPNPVIRRHLVESMAVLLFKLVSFLSGMPDLKPESLSLEHPPSSPTAQTALEEILGTRINFNTDKNLLSVHKSLLDAPMNTYGDEAMRHAENLAKKQLAQQQEQQSHIAQIKLQVRNLMAASSPRREIVADRLGMSVRTLDRRLADAGLSWQQLLDSLRTQLAHEFLADPALTVQGIAARLGFADARSFQRRFQHWTGTTPSRYRASLALDKS